MESVALPGRVGRVQEREASTEQTSPRQSPLDSPRTSICAHKPWNRRHFAICINDVACEKSFDHEWWLKEKHFCFQTHPSYALFLSAFPSRKKKQAGAKNKPICLKLRDMQNNTVPRRSSRHPELLEFFAKSVNEASASPSATELYWKCPWSIKMRAGCRARNMNEYSCVQRKAWIISLKGEIAYLFFAVARNFAERKHGRKHEQNIRNERCNPHEYFATRAFVSTRMPQFDCSRFDDSKTGKKHECSGEFN